MKYYVDPKTSELYAYESDGSQDKFIGKSLKLLDDKGLAEVRAVQAAAAAQTAEQVLAAANSQRDSLLGVAALRIAPLQYALDLGIATEADKEALTLWKQYSVDINRVTDKATYPNEITWPAPPGE